MGRLTAKLVQSAYKVSYGRNEYGDTNYTTASAASPCMYRDISLLNQTSNREDVSLDGLLWFDANEVVAKGDIYLLEGQYLRIERVVVAMARLTDNAIEFYKCEVTKQRQIS
jgi:hypothetical protein